MLRASGFPRHPCSQRRKAGWEAVAMPVRRNGRGPRQNRPLVRWPRWVQAWREDHEQHAGARVIARRLPGEAGVTWLVILDRGLDPADPGIRAELESALTELRAVTGVEGSAGSEPGWVRLFHSDRFDQAVRL